MLAVPYSRVSSASQNDGRGLVRQALSPATYCQQRGWFLYDGHAYSDRGVSAYGGSNLSDGALGRFLQDVKAGRFGVEPVALLIEDLDRFSRQHPLAILPVIVDDLLGAGVTIAVMSKGRDISAATIRQNQMELHELLFWLSGSHEFSAKLSARLEDVHLGRREKLRDGEPVSPKSAPAWIDLRNGQWVLNGYAKVVRRILDMAATSGCYVIASQLNEEGVPTPGAVRRQQWAAANGKAYKPVAWTSASVRQVIASPAIIGDRTVMKAGHKQRLREWQEQCALLRRRGVKEGDLPRQPRREYEAPQKGYYPALATEAEQAGLLLAMATRRRTEAGRKDQYSWIGQGGLTWCVCGAPIGACYQVLTRATNPTKAFRLECKGRRKNSTGCQQPKTALKDVQAHVLTRISQEAFLTLLDCDKRRHQQTALAAAMASRAQVQSKLDQVDAALRAGEQAMAAETDAAVLGVLARRQAEQETARVAVAKELAAAQGVLQQLQAEPSTTAVGRELQDAVRELLKMFASGEDDVEDRRRVNGLLRRLGLQITIDAEGQRVGLAIGDGEPVWEPLSAGDQVILGRGMTGVAQISTTVGEDLAEKLRELADADGGINLGKILGKALGVTVSDDTAVGLLSEPAPESPRKPL